MTSWNILCPGPSLAKAAPPTNRPTIVINWALEHVVCCWAEPLYWVCVGPPKLMCHDRLATVYRRSKPKIVTDTRHFAAWFAWAHRHGAMGDTVIGFEHPDPPADGFAWSKSLHMALMFAATKGGEKAYVYGCDMKGVGDFELSRDDFGPTEYEPRWWHKRWFEEQHMGLPSWVADAQASGLRSVHIMQDDARKTSKVL